MGTVVGYCPHCMDLRNMRAMQTTRKGAGMDKENIAHHCEICGLFVENEAVRRPSWDGLINSLGKFSADSIVGPRGRRCNRCVADSKLL